MLFAFNTDINVFQQLNRYDGFGYQLPAPPGGAAQHEAKVDVDESSLAVDQEVAVVSVLDAEHIAGD